MTASRPTKQYTLAVQRSSAHILVVAAHQQTLHVYAALRAPTFVSQLGRCHNVQRRLEQASTGGIRLRNCRVTSLVTLIPSTDGTMGRDNDDDGRFCLDVSPSSSSSTLVNGSK
jgi:hypothetical protein